MAAGIQAFNDSGLEVNEENATRMGVCIGFWNWWDWMVSKNVVTLF